ncbi:unnamed protein product [Clonostachys solani]|uniref:Uncharacterized protein n=1 Tax=Clonostachys solani TaxID=160281 RepID=A0A9N9ZLM4_9HYPO|nr:unnamed protein product [Clonostachys solani]
MDQEKIFGRSPVRNRSERQNEPPIPNKPTHLLSTAMVKTKERESMVPQDTQIRVKQLERDLQAITRERDEALNGIHKVFDDIIVIEDKLHEEQRLSAGKDEEIIKLNEENMRLLGEIKTKDDKLVNLRRLNEGQEKALSRQISETRTLQHRFESMSRNGASTAATQQSQKDWEAKLKTKESQLQEMATQLEMLRKQCTSDQQRREAAEAQLNSLQTTSLVQDSQAKDVAELRRLLTWHQTIGEQASRNTKQTSEENRKLRGLIADQDKRIQGQEALLATMRRQGQVVTIPGSFT